MPDLVLHAVIFHKGSKYSTKEICLKKAKEMFPLEKIKTFVRETEGSFRVRVKPKTKFNKESYVSKTVNPDITLVFGKLINDKIK
jgi:hypothetical protein